ncbi:MAG TPA: Rieske (2Fe-2S) protein [Pelobium sp.]
MKWIKIAIASLSPADVQLINLKKQKLVLVRKDNHFYVFKNKCPHAGADLSNGWCKNDYLVCPIHRYSYQLKNGKGAKGQGDYLKHYPVKIAGDQLLIGLKEPWFKFW